MKTKKLTEKQIMLRKFRKFLYDNDVLIEFYYNTRQNELRYIKKPTKINVNNCILGAYDYHYSAITNGLFKWKDTHEGYYFWEDIHLKWLQYVEEMKIEAFNKILGLK